MSRAPTRAAASPRAPWVMPEARHRGGLAGHGLGVLGQPWLRRRASGITHGARGDAAALVGALLTGPSPKEPDDEDT